jgi:nitrite reductase/ring-hydroxylating ferredoxin subunit
MLRNLDASYYVDPALHARERAAIFRTHWHLLGPVSQVADPGQYVAAELAGEKLFALRGRDGVLRAFRNVCPHRGARLLEEGAGRCDTLRCPYHMWLFDETGRLRRTPWFGEDAGFDTADWPLTPASVAVWRGLLFVSAAPDLSLTEQLGDLPDEVADYPLETFSPVASHRFEMQCNWKTYESGTELGVRPRHLGGPRSDARRSPRLAPAGGDARLAATTAYVVACSCGRSPNCSQQILRQKWRSGAQPGNAGHSPRAP